MKSWTAKIMIAATLTTAGLSLPLASPASAAPNYCSASKYNNGTTAYCYASASGTQFRAVARCRYLTPSGSFDYSNYYGPWRTQGDPLSSIAVCAAGWNFFEPNAQLK